MVRSGGHLLRVIKLDTSSKIIDCWLFEGAHTTSQGCAPKWFLLLHQLPEW